jgi:hypothetical protein
VNSFQKFFVVQIAFTSPHTLLLLERGNFELLIFSLVAFYLFLSQKGLSLINLNLILFASLIKFYPIILLLLAFKVAESIYKKIVIFSLTAGFSILILIIDFPPNLSATQTYCCSFGNNIWGLYLIKAGIDLNSLEVSLSGILLTLFAALLLFILRKGSKRVVCFRYLNLSLEIEKHLKFYVINFYLLSIVLYILGTSFDYKLVYLLTIPLFFLVSTKITKSEKRVHLFFFLTITLFSYPSGTLQPIGDLILVVYLLILSAAIFPAVKTVKLF